MKTAAGAGVAVPQGRRALLYCDATNVGAVYSPPQQGGLSKRVADGSDVALTAAEAACRILELTGTLAANIKVIVPTSDGREYVVFNNTSGAFTLTVKTAAGTGVGVGQGKRAIVYGDAANVVRATADV